MAILSIPFVGMHLVPHVGGGAILHAGGGYVANTMIPAFVVEAFGVASGVLSQVGAGASAIAAGTSAVAYNPVVIGGAAIAAVAVGTYCYFHGIPAPIEAALSSTGVGTATKQGFMVSVPQLAIALILLGGAGYLFYKFYKNRNSLRAARLMAPRQEPQGRDDAEAAAHEAFGEAAWSQFGAALWSRAEVVRHGARKGAQDAVKHAKDGLSFAAQLAAELAATAGTASANVIHSAAGVGAIAGGHASSWLSRLRGSWSRS